MKKATESAGVPVVATSTAQPEGQPAPDSEELHALLLDEIASNADTLVGMLEQAIGEGSADANTLCAMLRMVQVIGYTADAGLDAALFPVVRGNAADWLLPEQAAQAMFDFRAARRATQ